MLLKYKSCRVHLKKINKQNYVLGGLKFCFYVDAGHNWLKSNRFKKNHVDGALVPTDIVIF